MLSLTGHNPSLVSISVIQKIYRRMTCGIAAGNSPAQIVDDLLLDVSAVDESTGRKVAGHKQIVNDAAVRAIMALFSRITSEDGV